MSGKTAKLQLAITRAVVEFFIKEDLYTDELNIQGTVCVTADRCSFFVTQISKVVVEETLNDGIETLGRSNLNSGSAGKTVGPPMSVQHLKELGVKLNNHNYDHSISSKGEGALKRKLVSKTTQDLSSKQKDILNERSTKAVENSETTSISKSDSANGSMRLASQDLKPYDITEKSDDVIQSSKVRDDSDYNMKRQKTNQDKSESHLHREESQKTVTDNEASETTKSIDETCKKIEKLREQQSQGSPSSETDTFAKSLSHLQKMREMYMGSSSAKSGTEEDEIDNEQEEIVIKSEKDDYRDYVMALGDDRGQSSSNEDITNRLDSKQDGSRFDFQNSPYTYGAPELVNPFPGVGSLGLTDFALAGMSGVMIRKPIRTKYSPEQVMALEEVYRMDPFLSSCSEKRAELARRLQLTEKNIQIWFQNKRRRSKFPGSEVGSGMMYPGSNVSSMPPLFSRVDDSSNEQLDGFGMNESNRHSMDGHKSHPIGLDFGSGFANRNTPKNLDPSDRHPASMGPVFPNIIATEQSRNQSETQSRISHHDNINRSGYDPSKQTTSGSGENENKRIDKTDESEDQNSCSSTGNDIISFDMITDE